MDRIRTHDVAVDRDFYKLQVLTDEDIKLIKWLVVDAATHELSKRHHTDLLTSFAAPLRFVEKNRSTFKSVESIDEYIDEYQTNAMEDYHGRMEQSFLPILEDVLRGDLSFYEDGDKCITFLHFISTQHMRTKRTREKTIEVLRSKNNIDFSRCWNIAVHMFSFNIGLSLFRERKKRSLLLLENKTGLPFVTGDQPTVNLLADGTAPPDALSFYYPVSPTLGLVLGEADQPPAFGSESLTVADVQHLNDRICAAGHSQVFGHTEAALIPFQGR
ncbi:DUF4238 domain-containing protein [Bradyrhizobium canariense]|uniref:DUF4238 domain-containing protein n=1 Tax=Bradyrhizobium canariense TaxID=255045 RepID=A0A1H1SIT1_9BRAD|nr:DUF4238 domain-containing protein [Bradyrhizobium canariense]SDS47960.1 Protein of unknown function [Bradyrhizobium canariense]